MELEMVLFQLPQFSSDVMYLRDLLKRFETNQESFSCHHWAAISLPRTGDRANGKCADISKFFPLPEAPRLWKKEQADLVSHIPEFHPSWTDDGCPSSVWFPCPHGTRHRPPSASPTRTQPAPWLFLTGSRWSWGLQTHRQNCYKGQQRVKTAEETLAQKYL